jgi:hypothetical protein
MPRPKVFDRYDSKHELPLGGYASLVGIYGLVLAGGLFKARRKAPIGGLSLGDGVVFGLATYQVARIVAKDRVLAPFRAPFTKYEDSAGAGEIKETSRGTGLQKAAGDLLTCPYCLAPWVATAFSFGLLVQPRITRWLAGVFTTVAIADVAQQGYAALKTKSG